MGTRSRPKDCGSRGNNPTRWLRQVISWRSAKKSRWSSIFLRLPPQSPTREWQNPRENEGFWIPSWAIGEMGGGDDSWHVTHVANKTSEISNASSLTMPFFLSLCKL